METITTLVVLIEHSKEVVIGAELEEIKIIIKKKKKDDLTTIYDKK